MVALRYFVLTTQYLPVALKESAPLPEPPSVISVTEVPTWPVKIEFAIDNGACDPSVGVALALGTNASALKVVVVSTVAHNFATRA